MPDPIAVNLVLDFQKVRGRSHFLWVTQDELDRIGQDAPKGADTYGALVALGQGVFDEGISGGTNVILLEARAATDHPSDGEDDDGSFQIMGALLDAMEPHIVDFPRKELTRKVAAGAFNLLLKQVTPVMDVEQLVDGVTDFLSALPESVIEMAADEATETAREAASKMVGEYLAQAGKSQDLKLYLTKEGKTRLEGIVSGLTAAVRGEHTITPSELFARLTELCVAASLSQPKDAARKGAKLLVIRHPEQLDPLSVSFLGHYLSTLKALRDEALDPGFSILVIEGGLGEDASQTETGTVKALARLRLFAMRYGLLETPSADAPRLAVREGVFVGRKHELKILKEGSERALASPEANVITVVKAEAGMGKTRLCQKHLEEVFGAKSEKRNRGILRLSLNNFPTGSGGQGGLASLVDSLESEFARLTESLTLSGNVRMVIGKAGDMVSDGLVNSAKKNRNIILNAASKTFTGFEIVAIKEAFDQIRRNDEKPDELKNFLARQAGDPSPRERHFLALSSLIHRVSVVGSAVAGLKSGETLPIFLLLDDFQWLDEDSAEFILNRLLPKGGLRLLVTVRSQDQVNALQSAEKSYGEASAVTALASRIGLTANSPDASCFALPEFSYGDLASLIAESVQSHQDAPEWLPQCLAERIVAYLTNGRETANTLFSIETFNLLADPGLYQRYEMSPVIEWFQGRPRWGHDLPTDSQVSFSARVDGILEKVGEAHRKTYTSLEGFNLASFAVLEERIELLRDYLGGSEGDFARGFLYFSALAGAPFERDLVAGMVTNLLTAEAPASIAHLVADLRTRLGQPGDRLCYSIDTMERTYEVLMRLSKIVPTYEYRHRLFLTFLGSRLQHVINDISNKHDERDGQSFRDWIYNVVLNSIKNIDGSNCLRIKVKICNIAIGNLDLCCDEDAFLSLRHWLSLRANLMTGLGTILYEKRRYSEAERHFFLAQSDLESLSEDEPEEFGRHLVLAVHNTCKARAVMGWLDGAVANMMASVPTSFWRLLANQDVDIREFDFEKFAHELLHDSQDISLGRRGDDQLRKICAGFHVINAEYLHEKKGDLGGAIGLLRSVFLDAIEHDDDEISCISSEKLATIIINYGSDLYDVRDHINTVHFISDMYLRNMIAICKRHIDDDAAGAWAVRYCTALGLLGESWLKIIDKKDAALRLIRQSNSMSEKLYNDFPDNARFEYARSLYRTALSMFMEGKAMMAIRHCETLRSIVGDIDCNDDGSAKFLFVLSIIDECGIRCSILDPLSNEYESELQHVNALIKMAGDIIDNNMTSHLAVKRYLRIRHICIRASVKNSLRQYDESMHLLKSATTAHSSNVPLLDDAVSVGILIDIGKLHNSCGDKNSAVDNFEKAMRIARRQFQRNPERWVRIFYESLKCCLVDSTNTVKYMAAMHSLKELYPGMEMEWGREPYRLTPPPFNGVI